MNKNLIILIVTLAVYSCGQGKQPVEEEQSLQVIVIDSTELQNFLTIFSTKYEELNNFKSKPDFIEYGFEIGGPYNNWLTEVQHCRDEYDSFLLNANTGFLFGDLEMLGLEYVSSKGKETDYSIFITKTIEENIK